MTTIYSGTKIRQDHNTSAAILTSVNANVTVSGSEKWTAPADGYEVKAGDVWVKVSYNGVTGWMAYIHKGQAICKNLVETNPPVIIPTFPEYFILTDPAGNTQRFNKA
jgi:hypothetical protein